MSMPVIIMLHMDMSCMFTQTIDYLLNRVVCLIVVLSFLIVGIVYILHHIAVLYILDMVCSMLSMVCAMSMSMKYLPLPAWLGEYTIPRLNHAGPWLPTSLSRLVMAGHVFQLSTNGRAVPGV